MNEHTASPVTVRPLTEDDLPAFVGVLAEAFLVDDLEAVEQSERAVFEPGRAFGAFIDGELVGTSEALTKHITLPGVGPSPVAAITSVAVRPDRTRRGALSSMLRTILHGLHESGAEPISALWASESVIYGRFGYGHATDTVRTAVRSKAALRADVPVSAEPVRLVPREQAVPRLRAIYDELSPGRVGNLARTDRSWEFVLMDIPSTRKGSSALRFAMHPDGYAVYATEASWRDSRPTGSLAVHELVARDPAARAALLRFVLDVDLVSEVTLTIGTDDPLPHLLADVRGATRTVVDALWMRLVDVDRALEARRYSTDVDVVLELTDEFCPWNAGRWRLRGGPAGATVERADDASTDLAMDVTALGAAYLGGTRLSTLGATGRVQAKDPAVLAAASAALAVDPAPVCTEAF